MVYVGCDRCAGDVLHRQARARRAPAHHGAGLTRQDRRGHPARAELVKAIAVAVSALALAPAALACTPRASQASLESKLVCTQCHTPPDEPDSPFAKEWRAGAARHIARCESEQQILDAM